jgi:uncharacterized membrane protein (UPF0182 family)
MRAPLSRVSRRGRVTVVVLAVVFLLFTLLDRVVDAWTDWLWFSEVKYTQVFTSVLTTRLVLFALFGAGLGLFVGANLYLAYRLRPLLRPHSAEQHSLERYRMLLVPRFGTWITVVALVIGLFAGLSAQGHWRDWMLFANSESFGAKDPQFGLDVSFYVFKYPFWRYLLGAGFTATVISVLAALAVHYLFGGVRLQGAGDRMTFAARAHLTALVAVFVLLKAVAYFLDRRGLLLGRNESAEIFGAGYTDINALLPAKEILAWISVVVAVAIVLFSNAFMRNLVWPGLALGLLVISAVAIGGIYPAAVQSFTVKPSPLSKESQYIKRSIDATRQAFGLASVQTTAYPATAKVPPADLAAEKDTVPNIRLLDPAVVSDTYTQLQQVRGFYDFGEKLDIDRYTIDGHTQDYVVGAREINYTKLTTQQSNWQNRHTVFTHGYGFVGAPANKLVCGGQPFFVSGFLGTHKDETPTTSSSGEACVSPTDLISTGQPRIYYGERMTEYAIVGRSPGAKDAEFDRPTGAADEYFTYDGSGGVDIGSYGRRLLYSMKYRETNFLLSSVFNENSKLLYVRDPRERVEKVAPFLTMDGDPYPAVVNGRILWILDGYTTASTYPYSQRINLQTATSDALTNIGTFAQAREEINYLRNSVKATVDAYTGAVTLYSFDESDPVARVWNKAFGGKLIKPRAAIPPELLAHVRYPEDQFKVQRDLLAKFHVTDPKEFFSGQDFWEVPVDPASSQTSGVKQPPYYLLAKFPGEETTTFQITAAAVPRIRQNLASLIYGFYDSSGNPKLSVLELPDDTAISGPFQVFSKLTSAPDVRRDLSLFQSSNSRVEHGNLLSLPVGGGMLYVEPLYIKLSGENSYPLMKKVLLNYGEFVAYADTLQQGIDQLVAQATGRQPPPTGGQPPPAGQPTSGALAGATARVQQAITNLHNAQQSGDFEAYGKALKELDDALKAWQEAAAQPGSAGGSPGTSPTPLPSPSG